MKTIKKLLPIAACAASISITIPCITSCNSSYIFRTTDIAFTPDKVYPELPTQPASIEEVAAHYFFDKVNLIKDVIYTRFDPYYKDYIAKQNDSHYSNLSYTTEFGVTELTLGNVTSKTIKFEDETQEVCWGCPVKSMTFNYSIAKNSTRTFSKDELPPEQTKFIQQSVINESYFVTINNYFVYLYYNQAKTGETTWDVGFYIDKDQDWSYSEKLIVYQKDTNTVGYGGQDYTTTNVTQSNEDKGDCRAVEGDDFFETSSQLGVRDSYYLHDVKLPS